MYPEAEDPLSTPSLGITGEKLPELFDEIGLDRLACGRSGLSTPSLGITEVIENRLRVLERETFNSLSRDHRTCSGCPSWCRPLSTPSLGITGEPHFPRKGRETVVLSTPSLGITEPDSGIFRLSAAFCRGTPSHE
jgi:hypothetical protein